MLILVAVTVNVAINGGLFGEANKAATGTEEKAIYDQIVSAMVLDKNGKINVADTFDSVEAMFGEDKVTPNTIAEGATSITFKVTGKKGTYNYTITGEEIILGEGVEEIIEEEKGDILAGRTFKCPYDIEGGNVFIFDTSGNFTMGWINDDGSIDEGPSGSYVLSETEISFIGLGGTEEYLPNYNAMSLSGMLLVEDGDVSKCIGLDGLEYNLKYEKGTVTFSDIDGLGYYTITSKGGEIIGSGNYWCAYDGNDISYFWAHDDGSYSDHDLRFDEGNNEFYLHE